MYELKKLERYWRVNLLGPDPRLMKKIPGRGLTKVKKHCFKQLWLVVVYRRLGTVYGSHLQGQSIASTERRVIVCDTTSLRVLKSLENRDTRAANILLLYFCTSTFVDVLAGRSKISDSRAGYNDGARKAKPTLSAHPPFRMSSEVAFCQLCFRD